MTREEKIICKNFLHDADNTRSGNEYKLLMELLEQEHRWIPVTERLPKEHLCNDGYIEPSDYVLVWGDHGSYGVSRYWGNRRSKSERPDTYRDWTDLEWVVEKPIAWMPLPKPYKAESEVNNGTDSN